MKDTLIPLDIVFINEDLEVVSIYHGEPNNNDVVEEDNIKYVLEVNSNSGINEGDDVELNEEKDIESGKISLKDTVTASKHASSMGGSDIWLEEGEQLSLDDMLKATLVASANDAAVALAEYTEGSEDAFVKQMNLKAKELGMKDTVFKNFIVSSYAF